MATLLSSFLSFIYIIFLGFFVSLKSKKQHFYFSFSGFLISLAIWKLGDFFFLTPLGSAITVNFGLRLTYAGGILAPAFFLTLVFHLCRVSLRPLILLYTSTAFFLWTNFFTDRFIKKIFYVPETLKLYIKTGELYPYFLGEIGLVLMVSLIMLLWFRSKSKGEEKEQFTDFIISVGLISCAIFSYILVMHGFITVRVDTLFLMCFLTVISFSMTKHNFVDMEVFITKMGAKGITILFVLITFIFLEMFNTSFHLGQKGYFLFALVWALYFDSLFRFIQTPLERKFLRGSYSTEEAAKYLSTHLVHCEGYDDVFQILIDTIERWLDTKPSAFLCIAQDDHSFLFKFNTMSTCSIERECLESWFDDKPIFNHLKDLSNEAVSFFTELGCIEDTLCFSIRTPLQFYGVIFVQAKLSEDHYSSRDIALIELLSEQVIHVLDRNTHRFLLEKTNEKLEQKVSEQVSEIESAMKMAEQSSKHASFGQLLMGIAHEVRNPAQAILGSVGLIEENLEDRDAVSSLVKSSIDNIHRLINIMETLLQYGKPSSGVKKDVQIQTVVEDFLHLREINFKNKGVSLVKAYETNTPVKADDNRLYQVVSNIITNAVEAMPNGGILTISITESSYLDKLNKKHDGVCFAVTDSGVGISEENKTKIFDSFFSTKYGNTGLGLPMVLQIVDDHEGMIVIDSSPGEGTTFKVFLPRGGC